MNAQERLIGEGAYGEVDQEKRRRILSRKALQNAVDEKHHQIGTLRTRLHKIIESTEIDDGYDTEAITRDLEIAAEEFNVVLKQLFELYEQDTYNDQRDEAFLTEASSTLSHASHYHSKNKD